MSYVKIWVHAVWGTKNRAPVLKPPILEKVRSHISANAREKGIYIDRINGYHEHIHILMLLKSEYSISKQMQLLKGESAHWANKIQLLNNKLEWADKFFAASVSDRQVDSVRAYIDISSFITRSRVLRKSISISWKVLDMGKRTLAKA